MRLPNTLSVVSDHWRVWMLGFPAVRWLFVEVVFSVELQQMCHSALLIWNCDIQVSTSIADLQPERVMHKRRVGNLIKTPLRAPLPTSQYRHTWCPTFTMSCFNVCITNLIETMTCATVWPHRGDSTYHNHRGTATTNSQQGYRTNAAVKSQKAPTQTTTIGCLTGGFWDICERGLKIGLTDNAVGSGKSYK